MYYILMILTYLNLGLLTIACLTLIHFELPQITLTHVSYLIPQATTNNFLSFKTSGSHSDEYEDDSLLGIALAMKSLRISKTSVYFNEMCFRSLSSSAWSGLKFRLSRLTEVTLVCLHVILTCKHWAITFKMDWWRSEWLLGVRCMPWSIRRWDRGLESRLSHISNGISSKSPAYVRLL
jgi:hypothetical protein